MAVVVYRPRTEEEIRNGMIARYVARRDGVTDVTEGAVIHSMLAAVSEEIADVEYRLYRIRQSFDFADSVGEDLDLRVGDLPAGGVTRQTAGFATGTLQLETDGTDPVPAGQRYARSDGSEVQYVQTASVTPVLTGSKYLATATVVCTVAGSGGSAPAGVITKAAGGVSGNILSVTNSSELVGLDQETDEELKKRALRYLSGLAAVQPSALIFVALNFKSSEGLRFKHASVYSDPSRPGYAELVVDDGTGLSGYTRLGLATSGTIPSGGQRVLTHQQPATEPIGQTQLYRDVGGGGSPAQIPLTASGDVPWTSVPEVGEVWLEPGIFSAGDVYYIGDKANVPAMGTYDVYTGPVAELQSLIQGDPTDPGGSPGNIAAGCRVRVVPPDPQYLTYSINLVVEDGADLAAVRLVLIDEIVAYHQDLSNGETLRINDLARALMLLDDVKNVTFRQTDTAGADTTYQDTPPNSDRKALRVKSTDVEVV